MLTGLRQPKTQNEKIATGTAVTRGGSMGKTWSMAVGGNTAYRDCRDLPELVRSAVALAESQRFDHSCRPEHGRLLSVLAAGWRGGRIGETGTGCAVGLAWMVAATDRHTSFCSIEVDAERAAASAELFAAHDNVTVLHGDWTGLRAHGPFDVLVLDGGGKGKDPTVDSPLDPTDGWLAIGGTVVLDDFTPASAPGAAEHDAARRYWLEHPVLHATEIRLAPDLATIIGVRHR
jgi:predicted O-methyltransferase YrrM